MAKAQDQRHTRAYSERVQRIHQALKAGRCRSCRQLAEELEVAMRTIKRDVDFMRCRLNLPVAYDRRRGGYHYDGPVPDFPVVPVTEQEVFALLVAHKAVAHYRGTPFERVLEVAFQKLSGRLDAGARMHLGGLEAVLSFRPFAPGDPGLELFELLTRAVQEREEVCFRYRNLGAKRPQTRRVQPRHLACIDNHWYLFAFDVGRQDDRTFVLSRMAAPVLTGRRFEVREPFDLTAHLRGSLGVFKGRADYEVVVDFDAWAGDLVRERRWHASQEVTELPGGEVRLRLRLNGLEEAERWVLGWGEHATVVRPRALAERVRRIAGTLHSRYEALLQGQGPAGR